MFVMRKTSEEKDCTETTYFAYDISESSRFEDELITEEVGKDANSDDDHSFLSSLSCCFSSNDTSRTISDDQGSQCNETEDCDSFASFDDDDDDDSVEQSVKSCRRTSLGDLGVDDQFDDDGDDSSCCSSSSDEDDDSSACHDKVEASPLAYTNADSNNADVDPNNFVLPKTLPAPTNTYKVVCLSFLEATVATSIASKVFDESLRMLKKGGLLYVVDKGGCTVQKNPKMRQMLTRVIDLTLNVKHKVHDIETREILLANGFWTTMDDNNNNSGAEEQEDDDDEGLVRWMGIKP